MSNLVKDSQSLLIPTSNTLALDLRPLIPPTYEFERRRMKRENIPPLPTDTDARFWSLQQLTPRAQKRLVELETYFCPQLLQQLIVPLISGTAELHLRALDWYVINYAKKHKMILVFEGNVINVYDNYRTWLKFWKRCLFDAFRRGPRIYFSIDQFTYSTTVGQLNYLYWAIQTSVLQYAVTYRLTIEKDMNERIYECRAEKKRLLAAGQKRKRFVLSKTPDIHCVVHKIPRTIMFR